MLALRPETVDALKMLETYPVIKLEYRVELLECDGRPWTAGTFTGRAAAWKRVCMAARGLISHEWPVFVRVYEVHSIDDVLVWYGDLRDIK